MFLPYLSPDKFISVIPSSDVWVSSIISSISSWPSGSAPGAFTPDIFISSACPGNSDETGVVSVGEGNSVFS